MKVLKLITSTNDGAIADIKNRNKKNFSDFMNLKISQEYGYVFNRISNLRRKAYKKTML